MKRIVVAVCLLGCAVGVHAQTAGKFVWQEIGQRLKSSQTVSPLGPNFAGEQVSLSNGGLSFSATDISLPGSDGLSVAFSRSYVVKNRKDYGSDQMLADWSVDLPSISGVFTTDWLAPGATPGNRCSNTALPSLPSNGYLYSHFWQGLTLDLPGGGGDMLVARSEITKPTTGGPYIWVSGDGTTQIACLGTIKNAPAGSNGAGQGFIATTADGTRYWFDSMAQYYEPSLKGFRVDVGSGGVPLYVPQARRKNVLFATRVEDRFGNFVTYSYSNTWNEWAKLTQISASDGRQLTLTYSGNFVSAVSDGTRTWSYHYTTTPAGRTTLDRVTLPDASTWTIALSAFTDAEIQYDETPQGEELRSCQRPETPVNYAAEPIGSITHPAGGTAAFTLNIQRHGRSWVPLSCSYVTTTPTGAAAGTNNDRNDDINSWTISDNSYTLIRKQVSGPGLPTAVWNYSYDPQISTFLYPGTTRFQYPVCDWEIYNCALPPCTSEDCAKSSKTLVVGPGGEWKRYSYGNTYRYNEGKLLKVESGNSAGEILNTQTHTYDLTSVDQLYFKTFGTSLRINGDGFPSEAHRPLVQTDIDQDGHRFTWRVAKSCGPSGTAWCADQFARPTTVVKSSAPSPPPVTPPTPPNVPPPIPPAEPPVEGNPPSGPPPPCPGCMEP